MLANDVTAERLRRLAEIVGAGRTVLSAFLDLDPREFGTGPARASAIRSLLREAERAVRDAEDLDHGERQALRAAVARLESWFRDAFSVDGARGLAIFVSEPHDLFEVVRLPVPTRQRVVVGKVPRIAPLARVGTPERWAVALASRAQGRLLRGSADGLVEVAELDDDVPGRHDQGGWSQSRYERSIDEEAHRHIRRVLDALAASHAQAPIDRLAIAAPEETYAFAVQRLEPPLRERLVGRIEADLFGAGPEQVLEAARPLVAARRRREERELLDRLDDALGAEGRAVAGLEAVLDALVQRRVATLLVADGFAAPGTLCQACGWLGTGGDRCPVDETPLERCEDIGERAVENAVRQAAVPRFLSQPDALAAHGGIAALLRF